MCSLPHTKKEILSNKNELHCNNMGESQNNYSEWKNPNNNKLTQWSHSYKILENTEMWISGGEKGGEAEGRIYKGVPGNFGGVMDMFIILIEVMISWIIKMLINIKPCQIIHFQWILYVKYTSTELK